MIESFSGKASFLWSLLPSIDGQTLISIIIGAVLTLATFWLAYKKTIGAQDERTRSTNLELIALTTRRVAVERERIELSQFNDLRRAKAYRNSARVNRLLSFDDVRAIVLTDVIENPFLDKPAKADIIGLLAPAEGEGSYTNGSDEGPNSERIGAVVTVAAASISVGALGSLVSSAPFIQEALDRIITRLSSQQETVLLLLTTATALAVISTMMLFLVRARRSHISEMEKLHSTSSYLTQWTRKRDKPTE